MFSNAFEKLDLLLHTFYHYIITILTIYQLLVSQLSIIIVYLCYHLQLFFKMYRLPHKKQPKRPSSIANIPPQPSLQKVNFIQRNKDITITSKKNLQQKNLQQKNINKPTIPKIPPPHKTVQTIPQKVQKLQKAVEKLSSGVGNPQLQNLLLQEIKGIKNQLREIKQQIGLGQHQNNGNQQHRQVYESPQRYQQQEQGQQQQNIANMVPRQQPNISSNYAKQQHNQSALKQQSMLKGKQPQTTKSKLQSYTTNNNKQLLDIGKIQPYMKQFKLDGSKIPLPFYRGYHKKSSKPVVVKYCNQNKNMEGLFNLYEKLWKNIVKAKKVCINKVYDLNQPLASNILALQMNRCHLSQIDTPIDTIIKDLVRAVQFMHQCGYLYRNIHPQHVMMSFDNNIVLLDLKRMRRFVDMKGKLMEVRANPNEESLDQFVSNNRLRAIVQGRKDDLQSIGYLALYLLEGRLPWSLVNMAQARSKLTLQALFGKHGGLLDYMIAVHHMGVEDMPNYDQLVSMINF